MFLQEFPENCWLYIWEFCWTIRKVMRNTKDNQNNYINLTHSQIGVAAGHVGEHLLVDHDIALKDIGQEAHNAFKGLGV